MVYELSICDMFVPGCIPGVTLFASSDPDAIDILRQLPPSKLQRGWQNEGGILRSSYASDLYKSLTTTVLGGYPTCETGRTFINVDESVTPQDIGDVLAAIEVQDLATGTGKMPIPFYIDAGRSLYFGSEFPNYFSELTSFEKFSDHALYEQYHCPPPMGSFFKNGVRGIKLIWNEKVQRYGSKIYRDDESAEQMYIMREIKGTGLARRVQYSLIPKNVSLDPGCKLVADTILSNSYFIDEDETLDRDGPIEGVKYSFPGFYDIELPDHLAASQYYRVSTSVTDSSIIQLPSVVIHTRYHIDAIGVDEGPILSIPHPHPSFSLECDDGRVHYISLIPSGDYSMVDHVIRIRRQYLKHIAIITSAIAASGLLYIYFCLGRLMMKEKQE